MKRSLAMKAILLASVFSMTMGAPMAALPVQADVIATDPTSIGQKENIGAAEHDDVVKLEHANERYQVKIENEKDLTVHVKDDEKGVAKVLLWENNDNITIAPNVSDDTSLYVFENTGTITMEKNARGNVTVSGHSDTGHGTLNIKGDAGYINLTADPNVTVNVAGNADGIRLGSGGGALSGSATIYVAQQLGSINLEQDAGITNISAGSMYDYYSRNMNIDGIYLGNSGGTQKIHVENSIECGNVVLEGTGGAQNSPAGTIQMTLGSQDHQANAYVNRIQLKNGANKTVTLTANANITSKTDNAVVLGSGDSGDHAFGQVGLRLNGNVSTNRGGAAALEFANVKSGGIETALVTGDIAGNASGVRMGMGGEKTLVCDGTITGTTGIIVNSSENDTTRREVAVYAIKPGNGTSLDNLACVQYNGTKNEEATQNFLNNIDYIIRTKEQESVTFTLTGTKVVTVDADYDGKEDGIYQTAKEGQTVTITVTTPEGYRCTDVSGSSAVAVKQEDGTWTITMPAGGGVLLSASLEKILRAEEKGEDHAVIEVVDQQKDTVEKPETPVAVPAIVQTTNAAPMEEVIPEGAVLGESVIKMDVVNNREQAIEQIRQAVGMSFGQAQIVLHTETAEHIDQEIASMLDERREGVSVTLYFVRNGKRIKIMVPGGKSILKLKDASGNITVDALIKAFGMTEE